MTEMVSTKGYGQLIDHSLASWRYKRWVTLGVEIGRLSALIDLKLQQATPRSQARWKAQ